MAEEFIILDGNKDFAGIKAIADYVGEDVLAYYREIQGRLTREQYEQLLTQSGMNFTYKNGRIEYIGKNISRTGSYSGSTGGTGAITEVVGNAKGVVTKNADGTITIDVPVETTTGTGEVIKKGASSTAVEKLIGAYAVATTVGTFAKDIYKHYDWWSDLSDAFINDITLQHEGETSTDALEVLVRRVTDQTGTSSYYKSFMKEEDIVALTQAMVKQGCFDIQSVITQDLPEAGSITVRTNGYSSFRSVLQNALATSNTIASQTTTIPNRLPVEMIDVLLSAASGLEGFNKMDTITCTANATGYDISQLTATFKKANGTTGTFVNDTYGSITLDSSKPTIAVSITYDNHTGAISVSTARTGVDSVIFNVKNRQATITEAQTNRQASVLRSNIFTTITEEGGREETPIDPDAIPLVLPAGDYSADYIRDLLRDLFPDWYNDSFDLSNYNPLDDTTELSKYLPIGFPSYLPNTEPIPDDYKQPEAQKGKIPDDDDKIKDILSDLLKPYIDKTGGTDTPTPEDTPTKPSAGIVGGSSNSLWAVYNPTFGEVTALGSYLWSSSIIDIIQKFMSNPMDTIISLHMIYATPTTGGTQNIKLGYLDSGVSSKVVTNQFTTIDCGTIAIPEYFGDARDYSPYTQVSIFLPFIGIRSLSTEDVIGCTINVSYNIDVITGAILCNITVFKRGASQILYTYAGNCSVQIPLTGADRTRLLSGAISTVGGAIGGGAVGGVGGAIIGAVGGASTGLHNSANVERTGSFSANAGAMGVKTPYVIVNRKERYDANNYRTFKGIPSNTTVRLGNCKGYTRVSDVHVDVITTATNEEKNLIEQILKNGVIVQ